jgi:hypothetical protein
MSMFELTVPKRTMFFMGPQRAGKTLAMQQLVKMCAEQRQRILLVGEPNNLSSFMHDAGLYDVGGHTIDHLPLVARDATAQHLRASMYDLVAFVGSTVFVEPGKVLLYGAAPEGIVKFFERLCEPTAMLPRVYFEAHFIGHDRDVAVG